MSNIAYKYRAYPNAEQEVFFKKTFGCCRLIWNLMLSDAKNTYRKTGKLVIPMPASYKGGRPFLREVDSLALANVWINLKRAYKSAFANKKASFPKYKTKKHDMLSYTTNNQHGTIEIGKNYIKLPKVGKVKAKIHRRVPCGYILKSATVSESKSGKYYISILYEFEDTNVSAADAADVCTTVGLDYKSDGLYVDSNGISANMPHFYRESESRLAWLQKQLARKKRGSKNYNKLLTRINRLSEHIANQRKDFLHKTSSAITKQNDVICVETLNLKAMSNWSFHNGKATMDNGYGEFVRMLEYKQEREGHILVKVSKWYPSSQLCSCCGYRNKELKDLKIRKWVCPECGAGHDRDINAARNILTEGKRMLSAA